MVITVSNSLSFIKITVISNNTNLDVLINTGITVSIIPVFHVKIRNIKPTAVSLENAFGSLIKVHGELHLQFTIKNLKKNIFLAICTSRTY